MRARLAIALAVVLAIALAVVVTALAAGSGSSASMRSSASPEKTIPQLRIAYTIGSIGRLDPARDINALTGWAVNLGLEHVMKFDKDGKVAPHLAESVRIPNPFTYVYTLRKRVKFWNGDELTATDVANAWNYYRSPGFATRSGALLSVRDIVAKGKYTVVVTLKKRDASWQYWPASSGSVFQKKFLDQHGAEIGKPGVLNMGTGPFRFDSLDPTRSLELSANPNYWGGRVHIQRLSLKFIPDSTAQGLALRAGEVDAAVFIQNQAAFEAASGVKALRYPSSGVYWFTMNTKTGPFSDINVRRAVAYAINRADMAKAFASGDKGRMIISEPQLRTLASKAEIDKLWKLLPKYEYSVSKARAELAKSKYPNGFSTVTTLPAGFANALDAMQVVAANLAAIGIKLEIKVLPVVQFIGWPAANPDQVGLYQLGSPGAPDPGQLMWNLFQSKGPLPLHSSFYSNSAVDKLLLDAKQAVSPKKRFELYSKVLLINARDLAVVPFSTSSHTNAFSSRFVWPSFTALQMNGPWALGIKAR